MIRFDVRTVAAVTGGQILHNGADVPIHGFSTDSRTLQAGDLFIPLRGERFDGHDYLAQAVRHGAAACLSEEVVVGLNIPVVQVRDTLQALGDLAHAVRREFAGPVVGVTGTSGKTTTKEMLAAILERTGPGLKSAGNFNNLVGVPLTLFGFQPEHRWAVIEMGMSARGEIARLAQIAAPQIGIITNVGAGHLQQLGGISGVARAKGELFIHLPAGGTAIVNVDDPQIGQLPLANGVRRVLFGTAPAAQVRAGDVVASEGTVGFTLHLPGSEQAVRLPVPGRHNVLNALAAAAAAWVLEVPVDDIAAGLGEFKPCPGRMELIELPGDLLLLEDSYNANPLSMRAALDALHDLGRPGRRIAILGDMLELGPTAGDLHREVGALVAKRADWLFTLGDLAHEIARGAAESGLPGERIVSAASVEELTARLRPLLQPGDRLLIKGSRGMRMERISAQLSGTEPARPH
ncbi:MAG: UDP-N-acetylmuramoyl-tripeptide--D-alanyl-D-alanine ligase [Deltaproteobacteria bacterium]|nr:MAG: UDP-N-acetylmuramoyl-tripeptide--D-alanyl-D-alanine ligase [Deltaproteobacteria bacterium]